MKRTILETINSCSIKIYKMTYFFDNLQSFQKVLFCWHFYQKLNQKPFEIQVLQGKRMQREKPNKYQK